MNYYKVIICLCILPFFFSCQDCESLSNEETKNVLPNKFVPITLNNSEEKISMQNLDFAFRLFQTYNQETEEKKQTLISPLSAYWALSMAAEGANTGTLQEFMNILGCDKASQYDLHDYNRKLMTELKKIDNTSQLNFANSIWIDNHFKLQDSYQKTIKEFYNAELITEDLDAPSTISSINKWCSENTEGHISKIIEKMDPDTYLIFMNALHFKGVWENNFDERNTKTGTFTNNDSSSSEIHFMHQTASLNFIKNDLFSLVDFPFGNQAYTMSILLPNSNIDIEQCIKALDVELWTNSISEKEKKMINVKLPKFNLETDIKLNSALMAMGLKKPFTPDADFSRLSSPNTILKNITQTVYLSIDEKGAEASAISKIEAGGGIDYESDKNQIIDFHVNRPFIFMIEEKSTHSILFIGKILQL